MYFGLPVARIFEIERQQFYKVQTGMLYLFVCVSLLVEIMVMVRIKEFLVQWEKIATSASSATQLHPRCNHSADETH